MRQLKFMNTNEFTRKWLKYTRRSYKKHESRFRAKTDSGGFMGWL